MIWYVFMLLILGNSPLIALLLMGMSRLCLILLSCLLCTLPNLQGGSSCRRKIVAMESCSDLFRISSTLLSMSSSQGILSFTHHHRLCISFLWDNGQHWQMYQNWTRLSIMFRSMVPVDNQFNFVTFAWDASCCFIHYSLKSMESKEQQIEIQSLIIKNITLQYMVDSE